MRSGNMAVLVSGVALFWAGSLQAQGACPPAVASLVPSNGVHVSCNYNASGDMGLGSTKADLPFDHVCIRSDKFPARITTEVQHYKGESAKLLQMQVASVEQQTLQGKRVEFEKAQRGLTSNPQVEDVSGVKTESVPGGTLLFYSYKTDCSEGEKRSKPSVRLVGVAHTANTSIKIGLEGYTTIDAAKAAAGEVIANMRKANFN